tara:strand:+ start:436 stop:1410 length:975 start_codon:yes stop_codon:yes gene_type:complete
MLDKTLQLQTIDSSLSPSKIFFEPEIDRISLNTLQINLGRVCNQTCNHCHVDAGPHRKESMTLDTSLKILQWIKKNKISIVDITGGAPELNPNFRKIVSECRNLGIHVIVRCNLTVIFEEGQDNLSEFYSKNKVELICSLPCYLEENVDSQRGSGVFQKSILALQKLNSLGYGKVEDLILRLVYNPQDDSLPPPQKELEIKYKIELKKLFNVEFNELLTITNMPINRFRTFLQRSKKLQNYFLLLKNSYNIKTIDSLMCRHLISVDWKGFIYDCDFNQMLNMKLSNEKLWDYSPEELIGKKIKTNDHCFGCTAGSGSSCRGSLT